MYIFYRKNFRERRDLEKEFYRREYLFKLDARDTDDLELEARTETSKLVFSSQSHKLLTRPSSFQGTGTTGRK